MITTYFNYGNSVNTHISGVIISHTTSLIDQVNTSGILLYNKSEDDQVLSHYLLSHLTKLPRKLPNLQTILKEYISPDLFKRKTFIRLLSTFVEDHSSIDISIVISTEISNLTELKEIGILEDFHNNLSIIDFIYLTKCNGEAINVSSPTIPLDLSYLLPVHKWERISRLTCPVCLELFSERYKKSGDNLSLNYPVVVSTLCNHIFHLSCLSEWVDCAQCPVCRDSLSNAFFLNPDCSICDGESPGQFQCVTCDEIFCYKHGINHGNYQYRIDNNIDCDVVFFLDIYHPSIIYNNELLDFDELEFLRESYECPSENQSNSLINLKETKHFKLKESLSNSIKNHRNRQIQELLSDRHFQLRQTRVEQFEKCLEKLKYLNSIDIKKLEEENKLLRKRIDIRDNVHNRKEEKILLEEIRDLEISLKLKRRVEKGDLKDLKFGDL